MNLLNKINSGQKKPNLFNGAKNRIFTYTLATMLALTGIFGCGGEKSTSPSSAIPDKIETKNQLTNSKGQVNFTDNSTLEEVVLEIVDKHSKSPIEDIEVKYYDGEGYEVFFVEDDSGEYMSSIGIYPSQLASAKIQPHNPTHIIETRKIDGGIYEIYTIGKEDELAQVVWKWKSENHLDFSEYNYERTIDYDEYIEIKDRYCAVVDLMWDVASYLLGANVSIPQPLEEGVEFFLGVELPTSPSEIVEHFCPELENPPQRWDLYTYENVSDVRSFFTMTPSNIPTVSIDNLNIEDDKVNISWKGFDKDVYDIGLVFLPSNKDLTRYLDGNSTSDLTYSYRIIKKGEVYEEYDWAEYNKKTSTTFDIPERGNYSLELRVKDEVDNIGEASVDFPIQGGDVPVGKIAFVSNRDGNEEIYVMDADGGDVKRLTDNSSREWCPRWSPDGSKIAFCSRRNGNWWIYVMNPNGTEQTKLTDNLNYNLYPSWSPDGTKIVFNSIIGSANYEICVMNYDGTEKKNLTGNSSSWERNPRWSPDGSKIAFEIRGCIYVMNSNGTEKTRLTNNSSWDFDPAWSFDGTQIVFSSKKILHDGTTSSSSGGNYEICVINVDGSNITKLTDNPAYDSDPSWSPEGNKIAFVSNRDGNNEIYFMDPDGTGQTRLTYNGGFYPDWGP